MRGTDIPATGKKCDLTFEWEGKEFQGEVEVVWKRPDGDAGLEFVSLSDPQADFIRRLCSDLTLEIPPSRTNGELPGHE